MAQIFGSYPERDDYVYFLRSNPDLSNVTPEICEANRPLTWDLNQKAMLVYKIPGTVNGVNTFDLNNWQASNVDIIQYRYVDSGMFHTL